MSQMTAARPAPIRARRTQAPVRRDLRVVSGAVAAGGEWFIGICGLIVVAGLLSVLVLNTALAQDSFELGRLQARSAELADAQEALTHEIDGRRAPARLAREAVSMGMVPADSAAFLKATDGTVLGVAKAATKGEGFSVMASPGPSESATGGSATSGTTSGGTKASGTSGSTTKTTTTKKAKAGKANATADTTKAGTTKAGSSKAGTTNTAKAGRTEKADKSGKN
ncbi:MULTISPECIES: hypothetical protein [unclassified Janibacter]|uniref:hypothetical protein n=1 Tax=unclassified Janibacter TaxID=2649294 RepID=UPI003D0091FC